MAVPVREIEECRAAHERLLTRVANLDDATARRPSRLPDWSVGHVLTHLARNADSVVRRLDGARRGVVVDQYPGGHAGRTAEIEAGAGRPARELVADLAAACVAVQTAAASLAPDDWQRMTRGVSGQLASAAEVVASRWTEVEVHHVDLGLGYTPADWPNELVRRALDHELPQLPARCPPHELLAWLIGRAGPPDLTPWE